MAGLRSSLITAAPRGMGYGQHNRVRRLMSHVLCIRLMWFSLPPWQLVGKLPGCRLQGGKRTEIRSLFAFVVDDSQLLMVFQ